MNRKQNYLRSIKVNGVVHEKVEDVRIEIRKFFQNKYAQEPLPEIELPMGVFKQFSTTTISTLEEILNSLEIKEAIWSCDPDIAQGYDSFNMKFIKEMWSTVGNDIIEFVRKFFISGQFPPSINTTWVSLVPKTRNPYSINEYMPISVVGCLYKIISKIITKRIKPLISET